MSRRTSIIDDLIGLAARLPWSYGVGLAVLSFGLLQILTLQLAGHAAPGTVANSGAVASRLLLFSLASIFRWVLPVAFLVGAGISGARQRKAVTLYTNAQQHGAAAVLRMSWAEFEQLVAEAFRHQGYAVTESLVDGPDGGVDLVLKKDARVFLVQCKHWRRSSVGVGVVRELNGVIAARGAKGGFVITSGNFTEEARAFAADCKIQLIDGPALSRLLAGNEAKGTEGSAHVAPPTRHCPQCGSQMLLHTARRGQSAGQSFWGCDRFPVCRGTLAV